MGKRETIRRTQDAHTLPRVKYDQVIMAADCNLSARGEREFEIHVVIGIAAVGDTYGRFKPDGLAMENRQDKLMALARNGACESRAAKYRCDLGVNGRGKREHIHLLNAQQCPFGHAVHFDRRAHHNRGTRLTSWPTAARLRASASVAAALGSTGMVTPTVLSTRSSLRDHSGPRPSNTTAGQPFLTLSDPPCSKPRPSGRAACQERT